MNATLYFYKSEFITQIALMYQVTRLNCLIYTMDRRKKMKGQAKCLPAMAK
jgi:hypothetical protein